jgi:hypothetical protein
MRKIRLFYVRHTAHRAKETIRALRGVFGEINGEDRITS